MLRPLAGRKTGQHAAQFPQFADGIFKQPLTFARLKRRPSRGGHGQPGRQTGRTGRQPAGRSGNGKAGRDGGRRGGSRTGGSGRRAGTRSGQGHFSGKHPARTVNGHALLVQQRTYAPQHTHILLTVQALSLWGAQRGKLGKFPFPETQHTGFQLQGCGGFSYAVKTPVSLVLCHSVSPPP